jgi:hypothetical protein
MASFWIRGHDTSRMATIDGFAFPSSALHRFTQRHPEIDTDGLAAVQAATRQWFRLAVRDRRSRMSMPSTAVDDLWHELVQHPREYAAFCDVALGRFLPHEPEPATTAGSAAANRSGALLATLRLAQQDEGGDASRLPLLFRIDAQLGVPGGRCYLLDCGGRHECFPSTGQTCLRHLGGTPKKWRRLGGNPEGGRRNITAVTAVYPD